jgi:hypothetical protein
VKKNRKSLDATQVGRQALQPRGHTKIIRPRSPPRTRNGFSEEVWMIETKSRRPEHARIQQAADEAFRGLTDHEGDHPPAMQTMAGFSYGRRIRTSASFGDDFSLSLLPRLPRRYLSVSIWKSSKPLR